MRQEVGVRWMGRWVGNMLVVLPVLAVLLFILYDSGGLRIRRKELPSAAYARAAALHPDKAVILYNASTGTTYSEPGELPVADGGPARYQSGSLFFMTDDDLPKHQLDEPFTQNAPDNTYRNLMDVRPPPYLKNYRNPCWVEPMPTSDPYNESYYYTDLFLYPRFHDVLVRMHETWRRQLDIGHKWRIRCLPYFYVVGFAKCATSDVYDALLEHPLVTNTSSKEIHYWSKARVKDGKTDAFGFVPIRNYVDLFDEAAEYISRVAIPWQKGVFHPVIVGDGTPSTVDYSGQWRNLPENAGGDEPKYTTGHYIHQVSPQAHVIILVRNPTERLYSDYKYFHQDVPNNPAEFHTLVGEALGMMIACLANRTLWACVNDRQLYTAIDRFTLFNSIYFPYLLRWSRVFPHDQFHVLRFEDYKADRAGTIDNVLDRLGLDPMPTEIKQRIATKMVSNQNTDDTPMMNETKILLDNFFLPYNKQLAQLMGDRRFLWDD